MDDENISVIVTRTKPERRWRPTGRSGLDGHSGQPAACPLSRMRHAIEIASQHLLENSSGSVRSGSDGRHLRPSGALAVPKRAVRSAHLYRTISRSCCAVRGTVRRLGVWGRERYDGLCLFDRGIVRGLDFATGRNRPRHHGRWCRPDRDRSTHRPCRDRQSGADAVGGKTGSGAYAASVGCRAGSRSCDSAPRLLILQWNMPYQGLATASDRDSVRWSDGAAPAMALYWLSPD